MKKLFLLLLLLFCIDNTAQTVPATCGTNPNSVLNINNRALAKAMTLIKPGGIYIPSSGTIRVLVVFVQFKDDNDYNPHWISGQVPDYMNSFIDATQQQGSSNYINLTNYFNQMSLGNYHVIGNAIYVQTQENRSYYFDAANYGSTNPRYFANKKVLQQKVDPLINFSDYDNWRYNSEYDLTNQSDGTVDMIVMVWRGLQFDNGYWLGEASLGDQENNLPSYTVENLTKTIKPAFGGGYGSGITVHDWGSRSPEYNFHTVVHELSHWLLGANHPYHFLGQDEHAFWGMLHHSGDGICTNAYESEKLGWTTPISINAEISNATLSDFISTGVSYKYHPANGSTNEFFYFENHQHLSIYDNATKNSNDEGIFIIHGEDNYNSSNNIKCKAANGDWNWENPYYTNACYSQSLPAFRKLSANRSGYNSRDYLLTTTYEFKPIYAIADNNNSITCNGYEYGEGSNETFNTTYNRVFAPWTNPSSHTWGNFDTNFEMQVTSQSGNNIYVHFYLGNMVITENTTLPAGTYNFNSSVTVNSGLTLTISAGSTLNFTQGAALIINGTLNAEGTSTNRITFTRSGSSGTWGGINCQYSGTGTLRYCDISYATTGVQLSTYGEVSNCNIHDNSSCGIYLPMSSAQISNNQIRNNGYYGIYAQNETNSSVSGNIITGNSSAGIYYDLYSTLGVSSGNASNAIRNNGRGASFNNNSEAFFGYSGVGGSNSICGNSGYEAYATTNSNAILQSNWWGSNPPSASEFYADGTSYIDRSSPLGSDPNPSMYKESASTVTEIAQATILTNTKTLGSDDNSFSDPEIMSALQLLLDGKYQEAIKSFDKKFANETSIVKKQFILARISECYSKSKSEGFVDHLNKDIRPALSKSNELYGVTLELEYLNLLRNGKFDEALVIMNSIKNNYHDSKELYKRTLYNIGFVYAKCLNDINKAGEAIKELETDYPGDELVVNGKLLFLGEDTSNMIKQNKGVATGDSTPVDFMLADNYPNPFNPSTNISFSVPQRSNVKLVVYDVLGKEVATLANSVYETGKYNVQFNGSSLASGMYFYTLTTAQGTISKKMLLVK
jgi:parallel beta-helix repeat protein